MITICICTYNNAHALRRTLESLKNIHLGVNQGYELLVVNNNCTDHTDQVVAEAQHHFGPLLRLVREEAQGLSHARNKGLREAHGDTIAFLDDDVRVDTEWLRAIHDSLEDTGAAVIGGRSYLVWPHSRPEPRWITDRLLVYLSRVDYGDQRIVDTDKELFGLNFAVSRNAALAVGGFRTEFGRKGRLLLSGEEADLLDRLRAAGGIAVYEPNAIVGHLLPPERITFVWFCRRSFWGGVSAERRIPTILSWFRLPRMFFKVFRLFLHAGAAWIGGDHCMAAEKSCSGFDILGRLSEAVWFKRFRKR